MQKVDVRLEDDLTGGPADETVHFGIDGRAYEIDLNAKHAANFRNLLGPFVERARLARARRPRTTARTTASREIRAWAEQHGFAVAEHGRLPRNVIEEYDRACGGEQPPEHRARQPSARRRAADHPSSKPDRGARRVSRHRTPRAG
ncbi:MAG TPA: Lsr2 family protein [Streptosporangiaceae bacterium]|jgi:hypothetical protein